MNRENKWPLIFLKKGQSISEYVLILALVALVLTGMQVYVRRGLQGRVKDVADSTIAEINKSLSGGQKVSSTQFEPDYRATTRNIAQNSIVQTKFENGDFRKDYNQDETKVNQEETVNDWLDEDSN